MIEQGKISDDTLAMAAVGRQFTDLAVKNEALRNDLQKIIEMYNALRTEHDKLVLAETNKGEAAEDSEEV